MPGVAVTPANVTERASAQQLLAQVLGWFTWLSVQWVDGGYAGEAFAQWVKGLRPKLAVEVVKRSDANPGFKGLPRRWIVERTFGWLMHHRRLVGDYETTPASAEVWIYIVMIRLQLHRLARMLTLHDLSDTLLIVIKVLCSKQIIFFCAHAG